MPPVARNTLSLRPQGFYAYTFLISRIAQVISLAVATGLIGNLLFITTRGRQAAPANLIIAIIFTSAALLWALFSSSGYSKRYLAFTTTLSFDLLFLVPFIAIAAILGLPVADTNCAAVSQNGKFEITAPPGNSVGRISFSSNGRAACSKLFTIWVLLVVVSALFALTALSVAFVHLGEKQLQKAIFAMTDEQKGGSGGAGYAHEINEPRGRGFTPTPRAQPGPGELGLGGPARPSIAEDRLNLNRPVTVASARTGNGAEAQFRAAFAEMGTGTMSSAGRQPRRLNMHTGAAECSKTNSDSAMPSALFQPQTASLGKAPTGNRMASENRAVAREIDVLPGSCDEQNQWRNHGQRQASDAAPVTADPRHDIEEMPGLPWHEHDVPRSAHASLVPKPLVVRGSGKSGRQRASDKAAESGWWGSMASVIFKPQTEYDPSNVM
ncbi:hypothetical protein P885DRAFT_31613 [Corynascus similis CBS 632.67]